MTQDSNNRIPGKTLEELKRQGSGELTSRTRYLTSQLSYRLYGLVPNQFRWLIPFVGEDIRNYVKNRQSREEFSEEDKLQQQAGTGTARIDIPTLGASSYQKYRCLQGDPLSCDHSRQAGQDPEAKSCMECGFPALLKEKAEIQGNRGRYRITSLLGHRGMGRLYQGVQLADNQPVIVKEYLLPKRYFNHQESFQFKQAFENLGGLSLADGRVQNSRMISPVEAIADRNDEERCYLVTKGTVDSYSTLRVYLAQKGAMSSRQVRHVLNQVLQSLESLHGQKFRLPTGQIQVGLAHGNLSLDSILISPQEQLFFQTPQFLVYLSDPALWERRFDPPPSKPFVPKPAGDLHALGQVAFYLLAGDWVDSNGQPLDPKHNQHWPKVDITLNQFIFRLLESDPLNPLYGKEQGGFESAEAARQALLRLPTEELMTAPIEAMALPVKQQRIPRWLWWLLAVLALACLGGTIWWWLARRPREVLSRADVTICCIQDVAAVPSGKFTYTAEANGIWNYVFQQKNLIQKDKTLEVELTERRPQLQLNYIPEPSGEEAIAKVRRGRVDFAVTSLVDDTTNDLETQAFAYDGLAVFVAFSYEKRDKSLPKFSNGQITFDQLRQLYIGQITNWRQLGGPDLPVKLYIPTETEAIRIFEQRVLKDDEHIAQFRNLWQSQQSDRSDSRTTSTEVGKTAIAQLPTFATLRAVQQDFENQQIGAIGFGPLSKVFGQCSAYPLALVDDKNAVQPLIQNSNRPIDPATDLCNKKGSYHPDIEVFQTGRYPLSYPLSIVYLRDNSRVPVGKKFADILKTEESQRLLGKTGLVPLQPLK